jgi:signal transduction histidine kinase
MVLAGGFAGRLGKGLRELSEAAQQIARCSPDSHPPQSSALKIAGLGEAFNSMAAAVAADRRRLQELNVTLEERLSQRTAEAEARSRELESFLYAASHDLRAPVLSIQGFANLLARHLGRRLDNQSREHLQRIQANAEAMDLLLRDLLEVSRAGRVQEVIEWVDSGEIVASVLRDLEPEIARLNVRVKVSDRLPLVAYSPRLLARVFRNLIDNAIKFMGDQPAPLIVIGCERMPEGHRFWVQDNGAGISPEHHEKIFGLFTRASGGDAPGSGVGLAVVRRIVETLGGRAWVEGEPGVGSMFCFTVPASRSRDEEVDESDS